MPAFDFPTLLWWGLPLAALPLLIHLVNLLRHKRVPFAAIEFLLASQRKYRTRVLLRQILLLLLRTAAVLGIVLALAQPRWRGVLASLLGGGRTFHMVLLDDSLSMQDRSGEGGLGETTAYDRARTVVEQIVGQAAESAGAREVSVARFTTAARIAADRQADAGDAAPEEPDLPRRSGSAASVDLPRQPVTPLMVGRLAEELARRPASLRAVGPAEALAAVEPALASASGGDRVLWLVSDFREHDWTGRGEAVAALRRLAEAGVTLRLVDCGMTPGGNLTVERLETAGGVPAAGVLVPLEVTVRNAGSTPARDVPVTLREDGRARPGTRLALIAPGGTATTRFDARFSSPGSHVVEAVLPADVLDADNLRTAVVDVAERVAVLLIDGDPRGDARTGDAFYVATALSPGAGAATGVQPRVEPPRALATLDLEAFDSVWLLDVPRLDPTERDALEAYVRGGGGVVFFTGPRTDAAAVTAQLHRAGAGVYPVPLVGPVDLPSKPSGDQVPDIVVEDHPVVTVLSGRRNPLLDAVRIDRVMAVPEQAVGAQAAGGAAAGGDAVGVRRLLSLRTGAPLIVERPYGRGTAVAVLTTAAPVWNNWSRGNPSWVVVLLELESHLARRRRTGTERIVGTPLEIRLDDAAAGMEVDVSIPPEGTVLRQAAVALESDRVAVRLASTEEAGAYVARWRGLDGADRERAAAVNVDAGEGRLARVGRDRLAESLPGVPFTFEQAASFGSEPHTAAGTSLLRPLLLALAVVLLAEQAVALLAGYHPASRRGGRPRSTPPAGATPKTVFAGTIGRDTTG